MNSDPRIGTELAGYRIEAVLGRGGMSVVYLAEDLRLGRKTALKLLSPELAGDERFRGRFVRESRLAASLDHPNIVPIFEAGEVDGLLFIAMRYVRGTDLKTLIQRDGPPPLRRTAAIIEAVAGALDEAHDQGLVHRDVKPANILITAGKDDSLGDRPGHVYLSDFGLTKRALSGSGLTGSGQFIGTTDYAAPEVFTGKRADARTDVYSLGCVLYECLTGEVPFPREAEVAVMYAHLHDPPPSVLEGHPDLPVALDGIVARALAKAPEERYPRCGDLATDVRAVAGEDSVARGISAGLRAPAGAPPARPRFAILAAALAAIVLAVVVAVSLGSRHRTPTTPLSTTPPSAPAVLSDNGVVRIDPVTNRPTPGPALPGGTSITRTLGVGESGVWITSATGLTHVDTRTNRIVANFSMEAGQIPVGAAVGDRSVWVASTSFGGRPNAVVRVDPATDEKVTTIGLGVTPSFPSALPMAFDRGILWVPTGDNHLARIDPATDRIAETIRLPGTPFAVAAGGGAVWVVYSDRDVVSRIDPRTNRVIKNIPLVGGGTAVAVGHDAVWVIGSGTGTLTKIIPGTNTAIDQLAIGGSPTGIAVAPDGILWITTGPAGSVIRLDPATRKQTPVRVGGHPDAVAVDASGVWVVSTGSR